jgi:hypothetical protein
MTPAVRDHKWLIFTHRNGALYLILPSISPSYCVPSIEERRVTSPVFPCTRTRVAGSSDFAPAQELVTGDEGCRSVEQLGMNVFLGCGGARPIAVVSRPCCDDYRYQEVL